jgi:hypothetical protein
MAAPEEGSRAHRQLLIIAMWLRSIGGELLLVDRGRLKRPVAGRLLPTERLIHERLGKPTALAIFASDTVALLLVLGILP